MRKREKRKEKKRKEKREKRKEKREKRKEKREKSSSYCTPLPTPHHWSRARALSKADGGDESISMRRVLVLLLKRLVVVEIGRRPPRDPGRDAALARGGKADATAVGNVHCALWVRVEPDVGSVGRAVDHGHVGRIDCRFSLWPENVLGVCLSRARANGVSVMLVWSSPLCPCHYTVGSRFSRNQKPTVPLLMCSSWPTLAPLTPATASHTS